MSPSPSSSSLSDSGGHISTSSSCSTLVAAEEFPVDASSLSDDDAHFTEDDIGEKDYTPVFR